MKTVTAREPKDGFDRLMGPGPAPNRVAVTKRARPVVGAMVVEEHERLKLLEMGSIDSRQARPARGKDGSSHPQQVRRLHPLRRSQPQFAFASSAGPSDAFSKFRKE